jgi:23S rRNA-/tRNA-specific pseudouridylate synthase
MGVPWSAAHKLIRSKHCYILRPDSTQVSKDVAYKLQPGDVLSVKDSSFDWVDKPNAFQHATPRQVSGSLEQMIWFENEHLIVIDKEAGIPC